VSSFRARCKRLTLFLRSLDGYFVTRGKRVLFYVSGTQDHEGIGMVASSWVSTAELNTTRRSEAAQSGAVVCGSQPEGSLYKRVSRSFVGILGGMPYLGG